MPERHCLRTGLLLLTFCSIYFGASAQTGKLPPFRMIQSDGKVFKARQLPAGKPIIIIYFSPECDHCAAMMKEFTGRTKDFSSASIAMVTYLPVEAVTKFEKQYALASYPNLYIGTEGNSFFLRNYYRITDMPFMALYTKNGDLVRTFLSKTALNDLAAELKKQK